MQKRLEQIIADTLTGDDQAVAYRLVDYLSANGLSCFKDECGYWENKHYFWIKHQDECVCYIALRNPDEPEHRWTVWSDDVDSRYLAEGAMDASLIACALRHVDECQSCGSCRGGKPKTIFGRTFPAVCGCTFRFDNPQRQELPCIEAVIEAKIRQISSL